MNNFYHLTDNQINLIQQLADGKMVKQLGKSAHGVVHAAMQKVGAKTKVQLIAICFREGLIK